MSAQIKYAYLKGHTWLYRRNYPKDVAALLGTPALKQSLKTGDVKLARSRVHEVNVRYERNVDQARSGAAEIFDASAFSWTDDEDQAVRRLRRELGKSPVQAFSSARDHKVVKVDELAQVYLNRRSNELRPGGFKSVRYSVGLFRSKYRDLSIRQVTRDHGLEFLESVAQLSPLIGKSDQTHGLTLDQLVHWSSSGAARITPRTQRRIWSQVNHWLDWVVYEGHLASNPFNSVRFSKKVRPAPYAVLTDEEVRRLLSLNEPVLHPVLLFCLLTGMRSGEASGLMREDLVNKGNLGTFVHVRPNEVRLLKTDAAERLVPVHSALEPVLDGLPNSGRLFPNLTQNVVTKRFARVREYLGLERPGLVFHSTRKWFITQCERTGVPEHFTASLVGHRSARSENGITYGIYSAGISDEQKRSIVDQIRLPT